MWLVFCLSQLSSWHPIPLLAWRSSLFPFPWIQKFCLCCLPSHWLLALLLPIYNQLGAGNLSVPIQDYHAIWEQFNRSSMRTNTQLGISRKTKPNQNKHQALSIAFLLLPCIYSYGETKFKFPGMVSCGDPTSLYSYILLENIMTVCTMLSAFHCAPQNIRPVLYHQRTNPYD